MLCITVKKGQWVQIGDAKVMILANDKGHIKLGVEAPLTTKVLREKHLKTKIRRTDI